MIQFRGKIVKAEYTEKGGRVDWFKRDMFTPLFLGAQLLVPSREDIQHEKLAEWMERECATVTHLTPAMVSQVFEL